MLIVLRPVLIWWTTLLLIGFLLKRPLLVWAAPMLGAARSDPACNAGSSDGGEKSLGEVLGQQMKLVASDVTVVVLKDTGHWVVEERPKETTDALVTFLGSRT